MNTGIIQNTKLQYRKDWEDNFLSDVRNKEESVLYSDNGSDDDDVTNANAASVIPSSQVHGLTYRQ